MTSSKGLVNTTGGPASRRQAVRNVSASDSKSATTCSRSGVVSTHGVERALGLVEQAGEHEAPLRLVGLEQRPLRGAGDAQRLGLDEPGELAGRHGDGRGHGQG